MVVTLIGYRGCGKSSVGRALAKKLGWECIDADEEIERAARQTIRQMFARQGETAFRDLEETTIARLLERKQFVLAAGGGAVLRESTRQKMKSAGLVVWLTAAPETLLARISEDAGTAERRPDLTSRGGLEEIRTLLDQRSPVYRNAADLELDSEQLTLDEIVDRLADEITRRQESGQ